MDIFDLKIVVQWGYALVSK